jgi:vesicle-fusing ATPase
MGSTFVRNAVTVASSDLSPAVDDSSHCDCSNTTSRSKNASTSVSSTTATDTDTDTSNADTLNANNATVTNLPPAFRLISELAVKTLYQSELKRDAKGKGGGAQGSSATNWIDDASSFALKAALDKMTMILPDAVTGLERDEAISWLRWLKSTPVPMIVDLTHDLWHHGNDMVTEEELSQLGTSRKGFLGRICCKLILLPSGGELRHAMVESTGTIVFGKLLYGGVSRYRLLGSSTSSRPPRRVGEQTCIKATKDEYVPSWVQFGGTERKYQAVDMGPCAILEISLSGKKEETVASEEDRDESMSRRAGNSGSGIDGRGEMQLSRIHWDPMKMFVYMENTSNGEANNGNSLSTSEQDALLMGNLAMNLGGKKRNEAFTSDFKSAVGGLNHQIDVIVRRVLDGRVIRPVDEDSVLTPSSSGADGSLESRTEGELTQAALEADELALLGLTPVRGLLLYGPPGCGKTALAREISRALRARAPKILSAPELLDRWVGSSEKLIRQLFADAEAELAACNGDATKSALHVIVIDEIDAVFRKRTSAEDSGEATRSSAVNQILAKLDGVNAIPNVLLIGMTNRRELLDPALLRPGRLEVQILVPKPDTEGRREILNIHFNALRKKGRLSKPLCCAIDGVKYKGSLDGENGSGKVQDIPSMRKRDKMKKILRQVSPLSNRKFDLAVATDGFSGADIAGLVRCAGSIALARTRNVGGGIDDLLITLDDVKLALKEVSL